MEKIRVSPLNWTIGLPKTIETAPTGATVVVTTDAMRQLGERAATRMNRPDLTFEVADVRVGDQPTNLRRTDPT